MVNVNKRYKPRKERYSDLGLFNNFIIYLKTNHIIKYSYQKKIIYVIIKYFIFSSLMVVLVNIMLNILVFNIKTITVCSIKDLIETINYFLLNFNNELCYRSLEASNNLMDITSIEKNNYVNYSNNNNELTLFNKNKIDKNYSNQQNPAGTLVKLNTPKPVGSVKLVEDALNKKLIKIGRVTSDTVVESHSLLTKNPYLRFYSKKEIENIVEPNNLQILPSYKVVNNGSITTKSLVTVDQLIKLQGDSINLGEDPFALKKQQLEASRLLEIEIKNKNYLAIPTNLCNAMKVQPDINNLNNYFTINNNILNIDALNNYNNNYFTEIIKIMDSILNDKILINKIIRSNNTIDLLNLIKLDIFLEQINTEDFVESPINTVPKNYLWCSLETNKPSEIKELVALAVKGCKLNGVSEEGINTFFMPYGRDLRFWLNGSTPLSNIITNRHYHIDLLIKPYQGTDKDIPDYPNFRYLFSDLTFIEFFNINPKGIVAGVEFSLDLDNTSEAVKKEPRKNESAYVYNVKAPNIFNKKLDFKEKIIQKYGQGIQFENQNAEIFQMEIKSSLFFLKVFNTSLNLFIQDQIHFLIDRFTPNITLPQLYKEFYADPSHQITPLEALNDVQWAIRHNSEYSVNPSDHSETESIYNDYTDNE